MEDPMTERPEDIRTDDELRFSRSRLLKRAGVAAATIGVGATLASCGNDEPAKQVPGDVNASSYPPMPPMPGMTAPTTRHLTSFFTKEEAATVDAMVARLIPGNNASPGAREAAVPTYIDTKLAQFATFATPTYFDAPFAKPILGAAGPQPAAGKTIEVNAAELPRYGFQSDATPQDAYRAGLAALDRFTRKEHGVRFTRLEAARQDAVLEVLESGEAAGFPEAKGFFKMVLEDTYEGMFADPEYGGNRDYAGWKLVGYPGAQRAYTAHELQNGPQYKRVQGLRDMPPMNPGVPQDHVILPLAGTRPEKRS
jgi:gluconate 2-dehydrogenase gamma chain